MGDRWGAGVSGSEQYIKLQGPEEKKRFSWMTAGGALQQWMKVADKVAMVGRSLQKGQ